MRVLYSHHDWVKGTSIEGFEIDNIADLCRDKLIPADTQEELSIIDPFKSSDWLEDLDTCQALVFTSISGMISLTIYNQVVCALNRDKKVYYYLSGRLHLVGGVDGFVGSFAKNVVYNGDEEVYALINVPDSRR